MKPASASRPNRDPALHRPRRRKRFDLRRDVRARSPRRGPRTFEAEPAHWGEMEQSLAPAAHPNGSARRTSCSPPGASRWRKHTGSSRSDNFKGRDASTPAHCAASRRSTSAGKRVSASSAPARRAVQVDPDRSRSRPQHPIRLPAHAQLLDPRAQRARSIQEEVNPGQGRVRRAAPAREPVARLRALEPGARAIGAEERHAGGAQARVRGALEERGGSDPFGAYSDIVTDAWPTRRRRRPCARRSARVG